VPVCALPHSLSATDATPVYAGYSKYRAYEVRLASDGQSVECGRRRPVNCEWLL